MNLRLTSELESFRQEVRVRSGEHLWSQGFSEPGAGSDLASQKTRAACKPQQGIAFLLIDLKSPCITIRRIPGARAHGCAAQGLQLHGGYGMTDEYRIGHHFRQMLVSSKLFGDTQDAFDRVAASRAADPGAPVARAQPISTPTTAAVES